jgi:hypothetical protein
LPVPDGRFVFPRRGSGWSPRWVAASILAHAVLIFVWAATNAPRAVPERTPGPFLVMDVPAQEHYQVTLPALRPSAPPPVHYRPPEPARGVAPVSDTVSAPPSGVRSDSVAAAAAGGGGPGAAAGVSGGVGGGRLGLSHLVPAYGTGELWVPPMYLPPGGGRPIRMDSVVAARMLALADSIDRHPPADPNANPYVSRGWTFRRNGKTYGWDASGLHLGDFTIPNVVLALLSMPQGNIDQARANTALMAMRADILRAAARAQAEADFRQAVREIRARKQKERDLQQARDSARAAISP